MERTFPQLLFVLSRTYIGAPVRSSDQVDAGSIHAAAAVAAASKSPMMEYEDGFWLVNKMAAKAVCSA